MLNSIKNTFVQHVFAINDKILIINDINTYIKLDVEGHTFL